ncbi:hypothetical protein B0T26DRAFT_343966 [Lasiosphaeria miniovina]|uniref:Gfd2/YDR514C-like C-terminal domain-containing protein n=1 Tax=Lasiosphaeria miniovina TaxID=1954250 RepID=A0AA40ABQ1_9PEZI|nr:uncharacterized protein B0T26DRAFT_343966 [Lasiosphaeria miniovina]KAK0712708.1 hypothetical protein B0T26DRAFT_343966 [Lasiosphaeria miniovina]
MPVLDFDRIAVKLSSRFARHGRINPWPSIDHSLDCSSRSRGAIRRFSLCRLPGSQIKTARHKPHYIRHLIHHFQPLDDYEESNMKFWIDHPDKGLKMTVVLRHLLGYDNIKNTAASPKPSIAKFLGHDIGKGIPESKMRDVRFLSIDVDGLDGHGRIPGHFSLGVSILDTQTLHALARGSGTAKPESRIIESHHFVVRCWEPSYQPAKDKFLFGLPETVSIHELRVKLGEMISHRDVVVLCHSSKTESKILRDLEIDLFPKYTLDTAELYKMQDGTSTTLGNLLDTVGMLHAIKDLHVAGNDANFTLRALLLLAVRDAEYQCQLDADSVLPYWISTFEAVALWLSEDEIKRGIRNRREERTKEREWQMELRQQSRSQEGRFEREDKGGADEDEGGADEAV